MEEIFKYKYAVQGTDNIAQYVAFNSNSEVHINEEIVIDDKIYKIVNKTYITERERVLGIYKETGCLLVVKRQTVYEEYKR